MKLLGLGGNPLPKGQRDLVAALTREFDGLHSANQSRLARYGAYRSENEASRALDLPTRARGGDYGRKVTADELIRHNIPLPFGQAFTIKHAHRVSGRPPDAIVDRRQENELERYRSETMEKVWWSVVRESGGAQPLLGAGAWDGSQLGSSVYEVYFKPTKQMPCIRSIDPSGTLVVKGVDDPHDFQRVYRFWQVALHEAKAQYRDHEFQGEPVFIDRLDDCIKSGDEELVTIVEMKDKKECVRFALGSGDNSVPLDHYVHDYGFVPLVVIPNIGPYRDVWGWADYEQIRGLAHYISALFSREADILRMVANGAYTEEATGQDPEAIEEVLANGGVAPVKREGKVAPIPAPEVPQFAGEHSERANQFLKWLGFTPDAAWGEGDAGSGSDRGLQLQPMLELTALKQVNWSQGLTRLGEMVYRIIEKKQAKGTKATFRGAYPGTTGKQQNAFPPFQLGPDLDPFQSTDAFADDSELELPLLLPRKPKELFDGDYGIRFVFQNRIDPDDPSYVLAEVSKFTSGLQSLETTLDRLGFQAPEDEMKLIEQEANRFPWLRDGKIAEVKAMLAELNGQGQGQGAGGGRPVDQTGRVLGALGMTQTKDGGALDTDAGAAASGVGGQYSGGA